MKIEIDLTSEEITKIVIEHLQPMFPSKHITGEMNRYSDSHFSVIDKKPEEIAGEENNANTKNQ